MAFVKFKPIASHFRFYTSISSNQLDNTTLQFIDDNERIVLAFKSTRDLVIFTDKRIILIDKKGIRGFRKSIYAIEYDSISSYTLNIRNIDSIIEIITDSSHRLKMNFSKPIPLDEVHKVYQHITDCVVKK